MKAKLMIRKPTHNTKTEGIIGLINPTNANMKAAMISSHKIIVMLISHPLL